MSSWVIFTDLDETLLERDDYSFDAARPALELVRRRGIPVVFCTSKTAAETRHLQLQLGIEDPFIVESGGGIHFPRGYFSPLPQPQEDRGSHVLVPLALGRGRVLEGLALLKQFTRNAIRGFSDMTPEEVARETGLSPEMAGRACLREFDEPFRLEGWEEDRVPELAREVGPLGLRVSRGGRFYHLHGDTDKGEAVRLLIPMFRRKLGKIRTLAVGDSGMDLSMLSAVDVPIAVQRADGTHDATLTACVPGLRRVPFSGAAGWNAGVLAVLQTDPGAGEDAGSDPFRKPLDFSP